MPPPRKQPGTDPAAVTLRHHAARVGPSSPPRDDPPLPRSGRLRRVIAAAALLAISARAAECPPVVLIHGLGRTSRSMSWLARRLGEAGFRPVLFDYPSQREPLDRLVERLHPFWSNAAGDGPPHAVTHSMGGVLLWMYAARHPEMLIGRVVMLAPPGRGSELADRLAASNLGRRLLGPAGCALGTLPSSPLRALEPVRFELGVIAGRHSLNPLFSAWIPGADDGKVAVARAHVPGMKEFLLVPCSHTWIMFDEEVIRLTVHFLRNGSFRSTPGSARAAAGLAR